eukprot:m.46405 g.46405  ORF g.46405 m.46405 type:complete len:129 (-) comp10367_c0_seq3:811-1197(-)
MSDPLLLQCDIRKEEEGVGTGYGVSTYGLKFKYEGDIKFCKAHGLGVRTSEAGTTTYGNFQDGTWGGGDIVRKTSWGEIFFREWEDGKFKAFVRYNDKSQRHIAVMEKVICDIIFMLLMLIVGKGQSD